MKTATPNQTVSRRRGSDVGISVKLFCYLSLFTAFILVIVWVFQIGLLNYFYRQTKMEELDRVDEIMSETMCNHPEQSSEIAFQNGMKYLTCIRVFRIEHGKAIPLADVDVSGDCMIHRVSDSFLTFLYNRAASNGGVFTRQINPDTAEDIDRLMAYEQLHGGDDNAGYHSRWEGFLQRPIRTGVDTLRVRLVTDGAGEEYVILLNSRMEPLNDTVQTLETQFWVIAVILLLGALVLALLVSHRISRPIQKMNVAAKRLAEGQYDADFQVRGYREVTELSESLTHASRELSKNDQLQKDLLANISHDLRTPLTMIVGYSEVMRDLPGENTPENVQVIIDETQRLSNLVNDLLDLSKLQAGTRKLTLTRFDLTDTVRSTMERYEKLTQRDGYRIEYVNDGQVEVMADQTMILQVIYNLINNAINYTGEDKLVRVTQQILPDAGRVRIRITDSGQGIAPEEIPLIWDRYYKVDKVHRRAMIGTGLGLSIVKHILEQHETTYGVESKVGEGSTFWFELNVAP